MFVEGAENLVIPTPASRTAEGNKLLEEGKYVEALEKYKLALENANSNPENDLHLQGTILATMALCHLRLGSFHHCIDFANRSLALNPRNSKALYRRSVAHRRLDSLDAAFADLRAAAAISPEDKEIGDDLAAMEKSSLAPVVIDYDHPPLTIQVPSEVWQFISAWLPPKQKLEIAMHHLAIYAPPGKSIIDALQVKTNLTTTMAVMADVWQYNEPELTQVLSAIQPLSLELKSYRLGDEGRQLMKGLRFVLTEYLKGLDLPLWKYLPRGMRRDYSKYCEPLPRHTVVRHVNPMSRQSDPKKKV